MRGMWKSKAVKKPWLELNEIGKLEAIRESSFHKPVLIFKHSTRCSISTMALSRMENRWEYSEDQVDAYYLDLIAHRDISNKISADFNVQHESPQVLLIRDGEVVYHTSHNGIDPRVFATYL